MLIYKLTNKINGKIYIGQTVNTLEVRLQQHFSPSTAKSNMLVSKAIRKYGRKNFTAEILEQCSSVDELNSKEQYWIKTFNSGDNKIGYNIKLGGFNFERSEELKEKIRIGIRASEKFKNKIPWNKGLTTKTSQKLKEIGEIKRQKKQKRSESTKEKMRLAKQGKTYEEIHGTNVNDVKLKHYLASIALYPRTILQINSINKEVVNKFSTTKSALASVGIVKNTGQLTYASKYKKTYKGFLWEVVCH